MAAKVGVELTRNCQDVTGVLKAGHLEHIILKEKA
jgi:hypothetical protein